MTQMSISAYFPVTPSECYNQCEPPGAMIIMPCIWPTVVLEEEKVNQDLGNTYRAFITACYLFCSWEITVGEDPHKGA